jgi:hypothetical protein
VQTNFSAELDLCDYRQARVRAAFGVPAGARITLFDDGQSEEQAGTYELRSRAPLAVQLWMMATSRRHIGNSKSSMDFVVALWRRQLGLADTIEPAACYQ